MVSCAVTMAVTVVWLAEEFAVAGFEQNCASSNEETPLYSGTEREECYTSRMNETELRVITPYFVPNQKIK